MPQTEVPAAAPAETSIEWIREFGDRWLEAWNSHQADRILALMTEDVEYHDDAWPKVMHGHADVREFIDFAFTGFPDMRFELIGSPYVIPGEPRAVFHWRGLATHTGPMNPPGIAPTGRRWDIDGIDVHEYRDGRISRLRIIFDMTTISRQLGLMPAAGSRAERAMAGAQRAAMAVRRALRRR